MPPDPEPYTAAPDRIMDPALIIPLIPVSVKLNLYVEEVPLKPVTGP